MDVAEDHFFLARALGVNHGNAVQRARDFCPSGCGQADSGKHEHGTHSPCHACTFRAVLLIAHEGEGRRPSETVEEPLSSADFAEPGVDVQVGGRSYAFERGVRVELHDEFRLQRETLTSLRAGESYAEFRARAEAQGRQPDKLAHWAAHAEADEEGVLRTKGREGGGVFCVRVFAAGAEFFRYGRLRFQPSILNARDEFMDTVEAAQLAVDEGIAQIETVTLTWHRHEPPPVAVDVVRDAAPEPNPGPWMVRDDPALAEAVRLIGLDDIRTPGEWRPHVLGQEPGAAWGISVETDGDVEIVAMTPGPASFTSSEPDEDRRQANAEFIALCGSGAVRRVAKAALDADAARRVAIGEMDGMVVSVDEAAGIAFTLLERLRTTTAVNQVVLDQLRKP